MAFLVIFRKAEATSRGWPSELDNKKSRNGRSAPKGVRQIGEAVFLTAQLRWLMTRGAGQ